MSLHRFEDLRERLLRAGVAPRHVRRYLRELREHHDDLVQAELAKNADLSAAREVAWARLGTEESLARGMLERPELRSTAARFPALIFGAGPVLGWLGAPIGVAALLSLLPEAIRRVEVNAAIIDVYYALCFLQTRLLPVLLGALVLDLAARRRLPARWPLVGAAVVHLLAGSVIVYSFPGQLGVHSALLPWLLPFTNAVGPRDLTALGEGLLRAGGMLALSVIIQRVFRRFASSDTPTLAAG
jgi:hypothetical protein